jgi:AraC-like DNA-binding protein
MIVQECSAAPFRFSTEDVAPSDRTAVWREVLGRVHLHLDVEQVGEAPLRATVESHRWSSTSFYFSDTTPVRATRTPEFIQDGDGDFRLLRADGAGYQYTSNGVDEIVEDGASALLFNGVASSVRYLGPCHVTAVRVPRTQITPLVRGFDDRPIRRLRNMDALRLLASYTEALRRQGPTSDPRLAAQVANHVTDLVALALGACGDAAEIARGRGARAARLAAVKRAILADLSDAELSIVTIAARHGISPRYLRMLFESEGTSFTDFVLEQRLVKAHRAIRDPLRTGQMISTIAFAAGFGDLSYFNRAFRRRFGMTPSDARAQGRAEKGSVEQA